jgi:hypothetical protein
MLDDPRWNDDPRDRDEDPRDRHARSRDRDDDGGPHLGRGPSGDSRPPTPTSTSAIARTMLAGRNATAIRLPSRLSFRDGYRRVAEAERSPLVTTQNLVPTPSPIRPPVRRIWASLPLASSPTGWDASAALRFRSVRYYIIRLLLDTPSRAARTRRPCLVDGGFPPSGPQEDLTYYMSHLVVLCSCRAHQGSARYARR